MSQDTEPPAEPHNQVPGAVHEATRSLLRLGSSGDARRIAEHLVRELGGRLVPAGTDNPSVIPVDVSFGDGEPLLAAASRGSAARALLERHLTPFLLDARYVLQLSGRNERLAESASTDLLTGLPNRRMLDRALGRLSAEDTVIMLDLDHFKHVNDTFGHAAGDEVLRVFGSVLRGTVRGRDIVGRFGGEEFLVVLAPGGDADAFLQRLRAEWLTERPRPVTFSAGIAASAGDPDETVSLADHALYQAKEAGRDQWIWATARRPARYRPPRDYLQAYLRDAILGNRRAAVRLTTDLLDRRVSREQIVVDLLAAAQREVGQRWYCNELTPADEHLASGVTAAALDTLMGETSQPPGGSLTVVTCAEGDFHSLAAQMFGELLREHGIGVAVLGASTPAEVVAEFLTRSGPARWRSRAAFPSSSRARCASSTPRTVRGSPLSRVARRSATAPAGPSASAPTHGRSRRPTPRRSCWAGGRSRLRSAVTRRWSTRWHFASPHRPKHWAVPRSTASPPAFRRWPATTNAG